MAGSKVTQAHDANSVRALLDPPEIRRFVSDLADLHETGRPGFGPAVLGETIGETQDHLRAGFRR